VSRIIAELLTRRVEFSYEGRPWPLIFTHRALLQCENLTALDMLQQTIGAPSASLLRALLFSALSCAGAHCSIKQIGQRISPRTIDSIRETVVKAWIASMAEPEEDEDEEKPQEYDRKKFTWLEAWAIARYDLRLSDEEWLDMTPRQFRALQKARLEKMQREELMNGMLAATFENFSMGAPKTPSKADDFMLHKIKQPKVPIGEQIFRSVEKVKKLGLV
jgi:hypothetical protein